MSDETPDRMKHPSGPERVERQLELAATPERAWLALTRPGLLALWLADESELELRPGGEARFRLGEELRSGWVEAVSPPRRGRAGRLVFWWAVDDEPASRVELTVSPLPGDRTCVRVVETRPLEVLDLVGIPLHRPGGAGYGPALVAA